MLQGQPGPADAQGQAGECGLEGARQSLSSSLRSTRKGCQGWAATLLSTPLTASSDLSRSYFFTYSGVAFIYLSTGYLLVILPDASMEPGTGKCTLSLLLLLFVGRDWAWALLHATTCKLEPSFPLALWDTILYPLIPGHKLCTPGKAGPGPVGCGSHEWHVG